jgi:formate-dependent nitrite reductase cytochrome c552 subunit
MRSAAFFVCLMLLGVHEGTSQTQPVPYSHKQHISLGLKCAECHKNAEPGETMGLPASNVCMNCHVAVKKESPHIQKLAESAKTKKPIPWVRIYQLPGYVYFSHRVHTDAGATCQTCHGPVAERDELKKEVDISMGACMECHRQNKASNDCKLCHEER